MRLFHECMIASIYGLFAGIGIMGTLLIIAWLTGGL